ncbi:hypothetical protein J8987_11510 [Klebsiella quasipneumoniae subsp. quasipneumoniae]|uniref:hypothetical protein n=1 Tax=Klebsiella quasipneumoniae TaxID=1463165 RepID=UPI002F96BE26
MTGVSNEKNDVFLNRVSDITAKMSASVDTLLKLADGDAECFSKHDKEIILNTISDITRAASLILTDAINATSSEGQDIIKPLQSLHVSTQTQDSGLTYDKELMSKLPEAAVEVISQIGLNSAMKLFKNFGGSTFPIGKGLRYLGGTRGKLLQTILTDEEIKKLGWYFSGLPVYLPRCNDLLREFRNREFLREFAIMRHEGTSALVAMMLLCPKYGFSDRTGWLLLKKEKDLQSSQ